MLRKSPTTTKPKAAPKNERYVTPKEAGRFPSGYQTFQKRHAIPSLRDSSFR